jgi:hypothetical protein
MGGEGTASRHQSSRHRKRFLGRQRVLRHRLNT